MCNKLLIKLALVISLISLQASAASNEPAVIKTGFLTGNGFKNLSTQGKRGYVAGFVDGVFIAPLFDAPKAEIRWIEQCVVGMTDTQIVAIIDKWLADEPVRWHEQMNVLTFSALRQACSR